MGSYRPGPARGTAHPDRKGNQRDTPRRTPGHARLLTSYCPCCYGPTRRATKPAGFVLARGEANSVNLAICHPIVIPARGGAETYVADLCRRLVAAGHEVHLYAREWDAAALPPGLHLHHVS